MKRFILLTVMLAVMTMVSFAQPQMPRPSNFNFGRDFSKYEKVDSFLLKGEYVAHIDTIFNLPVETYLFIRTDAERKTAIVAPPYGMPFMTYNIEENERRIVLWYENKGRYSYLIYDKNDKIWQRAMERGKGEFRRGMRGLGFPRFRFRR